MQVMRRAFALGCVPLAAAAICLAPNLAGAEVFFEVLRESCVHCHGKLGEPRGNVNLFELRSAADLTRNPELIRDLVRALDLGIMPPAGQPPLTSEKRWELVSELRGLLHVAVAAQKVLPQSPIRRMNRFQYNNAVQDLFDLQVDVFALPERMLREYGYFRPESGKVPESLKAGSRPLGKSQLIDKRLAGVAPFPQDLRAEHGFDNRGDHLTLSPLLLESFLKLSRSIVESEDFNATTSGAWEELFAPGSGEREIEAEVRERLRPLLTRAFRRPVDEESLGRYVDYALTRIASGNSFTEGMKAAASAALASPRFLYLYEQAGAGRRGRATERLRVGVASVVFPVGEHSGPDVARSGRRGQARRPGRLARAGGSDVEGPSREALLRQLRAAMAAAGAHRVVGSRPRTVSGFLPRLQRAKRR